MRRTNKKRPLWIIKAGSQMVIEGGPQLIRAWMKQAHLLQRDFGIDVIWVTSGAIATARRRTLRPGTKTLAEKQALSALGQPMVMDQYNAALKKLGRFGSQVLLTADDLADSKRRRNLIQTLSTLVTWGAIPILNENDAVSTEEIRFGDNDQLSSLVAVHMKADRLILLTDVDGLYDSDPKKNPKAKLVSNLNSIPPSLVKSLSGESLSGVGSGGMLSKILAARTAARSGITTHLVRGSLKDAILKIAQESRNSTPNLPGTTISRGRK